MRLVLVSLLCMMSLISCSIPVPPTAQPMPASPTRKVEATFTPRPISQITLPVITPNPKCLLPCFYGIVPGRTTLTETASLLGVSSLYYEGPVWLTRAPQRPWYKPNQELANHIWFDENGIVSDIEVYEQRDVTLQEIVDKYGEPEAVTIGNPDIYNLADFFFIYASKGVAFLGRYQPGEIRYEEYAPTPDIFVDQEVYFPPLPASSLTPKIVTQWGHGDTVEGIYPWSGFGHPVVR